MAFKDESTPYCKDIDTILSLHANTKIKSPQKLWEMACEYFEWVEKNPLYEHKIVIEGGMAVEKSIPLKRAMTLRGLCIKIGMSHHTWVQYRKVPELQAVVKLVDDIIYSQKFEGAAAGQLNASIIARDLGLVDKTMLGNDPDNPMPSPVSIFQLPDNGRDSGNQQSLSTGSAAEEG